MLEFKLSPENLKYEREKKRHIWAERIIFVLWAFGINPASIYLVSHSGLKGVDLAYAILFTMMGMLFTLWAAMHLEMRRYFKAQGWDFKATMKALRDEPSSD